MLIIGASYKGRFDSVARAKIREGKRIGMMWVQKEDRMVECHVCDKSFVCPPLDPCQNDAWGECTYCRTEFVFALV